MVETVRRVIIDPNDSSLMANVVQSDSEPTKAGQVVVNPDGSNIGGAEWIKNLGVDTKDTTYFYFGFTQVGTTNWRIKRMKKSDYSIDWATGTTTPQDNRDDRTTLTYDIEI